MPASSSDVGAQVDWDGAVVLNAILLSAMIENVRNGLVRRYFQQVEPHLGCVSSRRSGLWVQFLGHATTSVNCSPIAGSCGKTASGRLIPSRAGAVAPSL